MGDHQCLDHFRDWLETRMTGCSFAKSAASRGRVNYFCQLEELVPSDVDKLTSVVDDAGKGDTFALIVFPRVRTPRGITRFLKVLATGTRWAPARVKWGKHPRQGAGLVGLTFTTMAGDASSVMGFAPLGCMPVTRRAPYVALGIWAGTKQNLHKGSPQGTVGFIDAPVLGSDDAPLDKAAHDKLWTQTMNRVKQLLGDPPEDDFKLKDVAFCLPEANVAELFLSPNA